MMITTRLADLEPGDLGQLSEREFRDLVNADLRHRVDPVLSEGVRNALRTPAHAVRWRATLTGMLRSLDSQLNAKGAEHEADVMKLRQQLADAPNNRSLRRSIDDAVENHLRWTARTERFASGVREMLAIAEGLCVDEDATRELDALRKRVADLEAAIRLHRTELMGELDPGEVPDEADSALWRTLGERS